MDPAGKTTGDYAPGLGMPQTDRVAAAKIHSLQRA
jgi:hypothetical protein